MKKFSFIVTTYSIAPKTSKHFVGELIQGRWYVQYVQANLVWNSWTYMSPPCHIYSIPLSQNSVINQHYRKDTEPLYHYFMFSLVSLFFPVSICVQ